MAAAWGMSEVSARMFGENDVMWYDENVNLRYLYGLDKGKETFEFCMKAGLIANKYECCKCGKDMKLVERHDISDGFEWRCKSKVKGQMHDVKRSVRKGSFFELSRMTLNEILVQVYLWVTQSKVDFNMKESKCSSKTVCDYRSYCREVCVVEMIESSMKVGGSGVTVEVDESKFGKRKFNRGKRVEGKWVFGGVERETGKCFMKVVDDRTTDSLLSVINEYILPGSIIISDCWKSYDCLSNEGFVHLKVNHSVNFKDPDTGAHTNTIEGTWGAVKRAIPASKAKTQLDYYLAEYVWRKKNRHMCNKFMAFVDSIIRIYPPQRADKEPEDGTSSSK
ncbi:uncharacterized protein LOC129981488 [Argiope bruennichi]|uniref:uncharacterized protein LOC129981488 n=1 Tax=Argiope bruennichi TaxID=94029 RepID=UPI002493FAC4|nr:uncharacterized protein LOC129981488 [Argiope bruennichi]